MSKEIANEIYEEIKLRNAEPGEKCIPHSDEFVNYIAGSIGISIEQAQQLLKALVDSHKIFAIEIVAQDRERNIPRIEGFVDSNLASLRKLKIYYQDVLVKMYENEYYKRTSYHQVVKELIPLTDRLNNTNMGQILNKAVMTGELERLLEKSYDEYTEEWKNEKLEAILYQLKNSGESPDVAGEDKKDADKKDDRNRASRAVDSKEYQDFVSKSKSYPLDRIIKIYGIEFFLRVHIRRYMFSYLAKLIEENVLKDNTLVVLREMLKTVKLNSERDTKLKDFRDDINSLERVIKHSLFFGG